MIDITLPIPVSANAIWRGAGSKVVKSAKYKAWLQAVGWEIQLAKNAGEVRGMTGAYMLLLALPGRMLGDIDNRHKAVNDALQRFGVVPDDKHCDCLLVVRSGDLPNDRCRVVVGRREDILNSDTPHPLVMAGRCGPAPLPSGVGEKAA